MSRCVCATIASLPTTDIRRSRVRQTFVFKSHILAGQAVAAGRVDAFAWLTREEVEEAMRGNEQWAAIEPILSA